MARACKLYFHIIMKTFQMKNNFEHIFGHLYIEYTKHYGWPSRLHFRGSFGDLSFIKSRGGTGEFFLLETFSS